MHSTARKINYELNSLPERIAALDGLRGIAILLVLSLHAFVGIRERVSPFLTPLMDGLLGVRIFFVVSGFIITYLLLNEEQTQKIQIKNFFLKRLTKLIPPLVCYLALGVLLKLSLGDRTTFSQCGIVDFTMALFFLTGFRGQACWPLYHTWSLSIEEVFYLTWAPVMAFGNTTLRKAWIFSCLLIGPATRTYNLLSNENWDGRTIFPSTLIPSNIDGIAFGCLAALLLVQNRGRLESLMRKSGIEGFSSALVLFYFFALPFYRFELAPADAIAIVAGPTIQAAVVGYLILATRMNLLPDYFQGLLNLRALVALGKISYSVYLVQQFLLPYEVLTTKGTVFRALLMIPAAIILGRLLYLVVERPSVEWLRSQLRLN